MIIDYLFQLSDVELFSFLICSGVAAAIIGVILIKLVVPHEVRLKDNGVIGSVASLIGLIYGVLMGITSLYLINNLSSTSDAVQREANAVANLYRTSATLPEPVRSQFEGLLKDYLVLTIKTEWPRMKNNQEIDDTGDKLIDKLSVVLRGYPVNTLADSVIMADLMAEEKALYSAREERLAANSERLSGELWMVIFIGTVLAIGINFLFGMNFWLHLLSTSAAALMASAMIFLLLTLDRPFQGEFIIDPDPLQAVLTAAQNNYYEIPSAVAPAKTS
jgi:Protein of unknown function (DUF4239)